VLKFEIMEKFSEKGKRIHRIENFQFFEKYAEEINSKPHDQLNSQDMTYLMLKQISGQLYRQTKLLEILAAEILKTSEDSE
jgi:hypothetical protein